jgi:hypothetical protein
LKKITFFCKKLPVFTKERGYILASDIFKQAELTNNLTLIFPKVKVFLIWNFNVKENEKMM